MKFKLIALLSLALGICGLYASWHCYYELNPRVERLTGEKSYAVKTDGTKVEIKGVEQAIRGERDSVASMAFMLGGLGVAAGCYVGNEGFKYGWAAAAVSLVAMVTGMFLSLNSL